MRLTDDSQHLTSSSHAKAPVRLSQNLRATSSGVDDLVNLRVRVIAHSACIFLRAIVMQQKTHRPVQFKITEQIRIAIIDWIQLTQLRSEDFLFPSQINSTKHLSTRQYARIVKAQVTENRSRCVNVWHAHGASYKSFAEIPSRGKN